MDVEKQFRETHTTPEPVSATSIQGDQAKESSAAIQKDEQPVQNVMVPFKQAIVPEETPREPQTACKKRQLIVFDPCDFQKTFLAQQDFHYETNWRMLPTLSWIQQTGKRSKWPPDHQDIVNSAKHIGLAKFCELLISD
ncbi:unnamed protein product [Brassica rapa subsp. narinosa]|nr:unnamed protein product [Brassica napus]